MRKLLTIISTSVSLCATPIVIFNTNTLRVVEYIPRGSTPKFEGRSDVIAIAPSTETNITIIKLAKELVPTNFWTAPFEFQWNGTNLVRLNQAILDSETAANAIAQSNAVRVATTISAKAPLSDDETWKAFALTILDQFNVLRAQMEMAKTNSTAFRNSQTLNQITIQQMKNAFEQKVEERQ